MSTDNHTPITTGAAANAGTLNQPLGQMDAAIGKLADLTTTAKSSAVAAINELDATKQDLATSQSANLGYFSPDGAAGLPGFRALTNNDLPLSGGTAGTFTKVTINSKGIVTWGGSVLASDIADLTSVALDTLGATTDITNNDASISKHGFMPKLGNDAMKVINGLGAWVKWAMGVKYNGSGAYTARGHIDFRGAGVTVQDDSANDAIRVTISGIAGGAQALSTLTDVSLSSPLDTQVLAFNYDSQLWENTNISSFVPTGHVVQNAGSNLTNRPSLNFMGNGVTASDNSGSNRTDVTITFPVDGWMPVTDVWAYASATTITVPSGAAAIFSVGDKIRYKQGGAFKYETIVGVGDALLTVTGGSDYSVANAAITDVSYSHAMSPVGFPQWFNYALTWSGSTTNPAIENGTIISRFAITGRQCKVDIHITMGSSTTFGTGNYTFSLPISGSKASVGTVYAIDSGTGYRIATVTGTTTLTITSDNSSAIWGNTTPITWAQNDQIRISYSYEI